MEDIHGEKDEEQGIKENSPNKKIVEAKEHHLNSEKQQKPHQNHENEIFL